MSKSGGADALEHRDSRRTFWCFSFNSGRPTRRGNDLLQVLLAQAMSSLKEDLALRTIPTSRGRTCVFLKLCDFVRREKGVSHPVVQLLHFYYTSSLMKKITVQSLLSLPRCCVRSRMR
jgi:hypothetical protein